MRKNKSKSIRIFAPAKINFSIDVLGILENGYHEVDMVMQQIDLMDEVLLRWYPGGKDFNISIGTNKPYIPKDERNLAYKAAQIVYDKKIKAAGENLRGDLKIDILKKIPTGAGMAGGSTNGAAVLHGLNAIWKLGMNLRELCNLGETLGADVPFCILGQPRVNKNLPLEILDDKNCLSAGRATGAGTRISKIKPLKSHILIVKPPISVSTKEVFCNIDKTMTGRHPNTKEVIEAMADNDMSRLKKSCYNVLSDYTVQKNFKVSELEKQVAEVAKEYFYQMTGSGPTFFIAYGNDAEDMQGAFKILKKRYKECYVAKTIL